MYSRTFWKDQIKDSSGAIIQAGTPIDQTHMDNIEAGVFEAQVTQDLNAIMNRLAADEARNNTPLVMSNRSLTAGTNQISFANADKRNSVVYSVVPVLAASGSATLAVTAIQKNGFSVYASAACTATFFVTGGITNG